MDQGYAWLAVGTEHDAWLQFAQVKRQGRAYIGQQADADIERMAKDRNPKNRLWSELARQVLRSRGKGESAKRKVNEKKSTKASRVSPV